MSTARCSAFLLGLLAPWLGANLAVAAVGPWGPLAEGGLIRGRQDVPDDPLAGLPSEDGGRPNRPSKSGKTTSAKTTPTCSVDGKPANHRDIGDLRATLAVVQRGPKYLPCPVESPSARIGLRITVDEHGKITAADPVGSTAEASAAVAKKVTGKTIAARREGATTGTVWLVFTPNKTRP